MNILPKPKKIREDEGYFFAESGLRIVSKSEELKINSGWALPYVLKEEFIKSCGVETEITAGNSGKGDIGLSISKSMDKQEYRLVITSEEVEITGGSREGAGYGIQTLCQIIRENGAMLPAVCIEDKPDIVVRGYYLDQARGRSTKLSELKRQIDLLSRYKINQYQLYIEQSFAFRGFSEMWRDDSVITPEEIMELDRYCRDRDIEFVPSIASFGHLYELLRTKSYEDICELEDVSGKEFSFWEKMQHHTVNVSDERSFEVIRRMLDEFLPLFSSKLVNICADETFDLGKGKSKEMAEKVGTSRLYMDFLKKLCGYVTEKGKIPMFWGDIVYKFPESINELPKETICMAWGYGASEKDDACKAISEVGANLYICPGVNGWNTLINRLDTAYSNIKVMCEYAEKYGAIGVLNTDWGDFGHINDPSFSIPAIIYGAVFCWNLNAYRGAEAVDKAQLNREISIVEYTDRSESYVSLLEEASVRQLFDWWTVVLYFEGMLDKKEGEEYEAVRKALKSTIDRFKGNAAAVERSSKELMEIRKKFRLAAVSMDSSRRYEFTRTDNAVCGIDIWNRVGRAVFSDEDISKEERFSLAEELEIWYCRYKEIYRKYSKEGMLKRLSNVVYGYADRLRNI